MTEPKWTPGPWALVDFEDDSNMIVVIDAAGARWIAVMKHGTNQTRANANLIAAAPDLYASVERLLLEFDFMVERGVIPDGRNDIIFDNARAAMRKARGE